MMLHRLDECFSSGFPGCSATPGRPRKSQGNPFSWKISWRQSAVRGEQSNRFPTCSIETIGNAFLKKNNFTDKSEINFFYKSQTNMHLLFRPPSPHIAHLANYAKVNGKCSYKNYGIIGIIFPIMGGGSSQFQIFCSPKSP